MSKEKILYEYFILRYVPDVERGEFLNVGLLMMCKRQKWLRGAYRIDKDKIRSSFPDADIERLECQLGVFTAGDVPADGLPVEERFRWLGAMKSAIIQCSATHPGLVLVEEHSEKEESEKLLEKEFNRLFQRLV